MVPERGETSTVGATEFFKLEKVSKSQQNVLKIEMFKEKSKSAPTKYWKIKNI